MTRTSLFTCALLSLGLLTLPGCQSTSAPQSSNVAPTQVELAPLPPLAEAIWAPQQNAVSVPFTLLNNHILLDVTVNGGAPLTFLLDSGASTSFIAETINTQWMPLTSGDPVHLSGVGDGAKALAYWLPNTRLGIGDLQLNEVTAIYLPLTAQPFASRATSYFDGILGADAFNCCLVEIDYDAMQLTFHQNTADQRQHFSNGNWQQLPLDVVRNAPYLTTTVTTTAGNKPARLLLDTGSNATMSLHGSQYPRPSASYQRSITGVNGDSQRALGLLPQVQLGETTLQQVPTYYASHGKAAAPNVDGSLGNQVLRKFNQVYDFSGGNLWLQPNQNATHPLRADRSGIQLLPHPRGAYVLNIDPATQAQGFSLRRGDVLTRINGKHIKPSNFDSLRALFRSEQHERLQICWQRAHARHCADLKLEPKLTP
ncbi:retroviral-like aspartic protease family protein [Pseudidiomarina sediminum]|nr:aspartyl protease family protein [Pseudidiomarina sediminum]